MVPRTWIRYQVTLRELSRAIEGHQPSSRSSMCCFAWVRTGETRPYKMASSRLLVCMFLTKMLETNSMMVALGAVFGSAFMAQQHAAQLAFARNDQKWKHIQNWLSRGSLMLWSRSGRRADISQLIRSLPSPDTVRSVYKHRGLTHTTVSHNELLW